jgi:predicted dienelactone hydrolase
MFTCRRLLVWAFATATSLGGCSRPPIDPLSLAVDRPGPFAVGYRELTTTYLPPGGLPARTIPVDFWYPTEQASGDNPRYGDFIDDPNTFIDAPPAEPAFAGGFPLLVHSHGDAAFPGSNANVVRYLVSHGWVVIEPAHVGNTLADTTKPHPLELFIERPLDVRAALDLAAALPPSEPLAGKLDLGHAAMSGHSFGTYTAWAVSGTGFDSTAIRSACQRGGIVGCSEPLIAAFADGFADRRLRAIIPMAGGRSDYFGSHPYDPLAIPLLLMEGSLNKNGGDSLLAAISGVDFSLVTVDGGCHELFNLGNGAVGNFGNDSGGATSCSALPDATGFAIVNTWLLAYLRYHVIGDRSTEVRGIIDGSRPVPRATLIHQGAPLPSPVE